MKPRTFRAGISAMPKYFCAGNSQGTTAVIQFEVSGQEPGQWYMIIEDGSLTVAEGYAPADVSLTITTPSEVWLRIMRGELNGAEAFLTGQAIATGDLSLLMRLKEFFRFRIERAGPPTNNAGISEN